MVKPAGTRGSSAARRPAGDECARMKRTAAVRKARLLHFTLKWRRPIGSELNCRSRAFGVIAESFKPIMSFHRHELPNGLEIIAEVNPRAYSAALGFFVRAGSRDETDDVSGVSHFLEHM